MKETVLHKYNYLGEITVAWKIIEQLAIRRVCTEAELVSVYERNYSTRDKLVKDGWIQSARYRNPKSSRIAGFFMLTKKGVKYYEENKDK